MSKQTKKPDLVAYTVRENGQTAHWSRIGAAWAHKEGNGFTIRLDAFPVNGEIVLRAPRAEDSAQEGGQS